MFFSGIADEAGADLANQIRAHRELGWQHIDLRMVAGKQFTEASDGEFAAIAAELNAAGLKVACFESAIANWARRISGPFAKDVEDLRRAIPRMHKLNTPFIRVMSWPNDGWPEEKWRDEAVRRMRKLARLAEDGGVTLLLENCDGWASTSAANYKLFFELVGSPALRAVYDTGNPAAHGCRDTWAWYEAAKPYLAYMHIKAHTGPTADGKPGEHVWPDSGASLIRETLQALAAAGYDGGICIEPHMKAVIHEGRQISDAEAAYLTYVEYGRRVMRMVEEIWPKKR